MLGLYAQRKNALRLLSRAAHLERGAKDRESGWFGDRVKRAAHKAERNANWKNSIMAQRFPLVVHAPRLKTNTATETRRRGNVLPTLAVGAAAALGTYGAYRAGKYLHRKYKEWRARR